MKTFVQWYLKKVAEVRSILCVGLDPTFDHLPPHFGTSLEALEEYLRQVIEIASTRVPVVKPQFAYYAAMGPEGIYMMIRLIEHAHSLGLPVILDAKRTDIGPTMAAYAQEVFGQYKVDACTFVPYMGGTFMPSKGTKSWLPYLAEGKCVISMVRTSNSEADDLQDDNLGWGINNYESVAYMVKNWEERVFQETGVESAVGGVIGATYPEQAEKCRELLGDDVFTLIPGYGAQGGGAAGAVVAVANSRGEISGTVNNSRGCTRDSWRDKKTGEPKPGDPFENIAKAIDGFNKDLNDALTVQLGRNPYDSAE